MNDKDKLKRMKEYLQDREGWDLGELIDEMAYKTGKLKSQTDSEFGNDLDTDECSIIWGTLDGDAEEVCGLDEFIEEYTDIFIEKICNVIDSFIKEE